MSERLSPAVAAEAQRILDMEARRILAERIATDDQPPTSPKRARRANSARNGTLRQEGAR